MNRRCSCGCFLLRQAARSTEPSVHVEVKVLRVLVAAEGRQNSTCAVLSCDLANNVQDVRE